MQNDSFSSSDRSRDSAQPESDREQQESDREQPVKLGFSITPQDRDVLQEYLQEFQEADTVTITLQIVLYLEISQRPESSSVKDHYSICHRGASPRSLSRTQTIRVIVKDTDDWTRIIEKAMAKLYHLHLVNTPFDKKDANKKWFYNHYARPRCQYIKFTRKWSARNAFYHLNRDEVLKHAKETFGIEPGDPAFLGALQDATTTLWTKLSPEVQEDYVKAAKEWSEETPPKDVQLRMASSMRERIIEDFQSQLYKTCGICSLVLTAYESEDNNLKIGFNDVSSVLEDFRKYCPDWKSAALWEQWIEFGKKCFAKDTVQEPPLKKDRSRTLNIPIRIVFDKDGCPELPKVTMFNGYKAKVVQSLLREYCTAHIRLVTRNKKRIIPWGVLVKDPSSWIFDECIPKDFVWKD
ncbi:hypothetical protein EDB85DRAFT_1886610 [Lactarius pseudohatsudake]|nr:hypothetical protein EDB85DRAFT_1886610 [Lactarius pseudohatsudake]